MNKYIDDLMEKHSPSDPYLMTWPQAAAAIREAMEAQREADKDAIKQSFHDWELWAYTREGSYKILESILRSLGDARVEGDE